MTLHRRPYAPDPYWLVPPVAPFTVISRDISDGQPMAGLHAHHSTGGANLSPHLAWSGFPDTTQGFVISCFDPDAPTPSGFWNLTLANLSVTVTELARGAGDPTGERGTTFSVCNDYGTRGYGRAAPPTGDRRHRYLFAVHATDISELDVTPDATPCRSSVPPRLPHRGRRRHPPTYVVPG